MILLLALLLLQIINLLIEIICVGQESGVKPSSPGNVTAVLSGKVISVQ